MPTWLNNFSFETIYSQPINSIEKILEEEAESLFSIQRNSSPLLFIHRRPLQFFLSAARSRRCPITVNYYIYYVQRSTRARSNHLNLVNDCKTTSTVVTKWPPKKKGFAICNNNSIKWAVGLFPICFHFSFLRDFWGLFSYAWLDDGEITKYIFDDVGNIISRNTGGDNPSSGAQVIFRTSKRAVEATNDDYWSDTFWDFSKKLLLGAADDDFTAVFSDAISTDKQTFYHGTRSWMVVEPAPYLTWWKQVVQQKLQQALPFKPLTSYAWQENDYLQRTFWWISLSKTTHFAFSCHQHSLLYLKQVGTHHSSKWAFFSILHVDIRDKNISQDVIKM